ncbi:MULTISPECIES: hypothetical protein [Sorangium]|uniref:hypothetical protein n=1 Tax=Sorangium TaxID=39643 RepID=UPI003D9C5A2D
MPIQPAHGDAERGRRIGALRTSIEHETMGRRPTSQARDVEDVEDVEPEGDARVGGRGDRPTLTASNPVRQRRVRRLFFAQKRAHLVEQISPDPLPVQVVLVTGLDG